MFPGRDHPCPQAPTELDASQCCHTFITGVNIETAHHGSSGCNFLRAAGSSPCDRQRVIHVDPGGPSHSSVPVAPYPSVRKPVFCSHLCWRTLVFFPHPLPFFLGCDEEHSWTGLPAHTCRRGGEPLCPQAARTSSSLLAVDKLFFEVTVNSQSHLQDRVLEHLTNCSLFSNMCKYQFHSMS